MEEEIDAGQYVVVVNDEEQYSIWWADRTLPEGWRAADKTGSRNECLDYIEVTWTDMRPASLRRWLQQAQHSSQ